MKWYLHMHSESMGSAAERIRGRLLTAYEKQNFQFTCAQLTATKATFIADIAPVSPPGRRHMHKTRHTTDAHDVKDIKGE
jgi:hypothetical protein